jgi:hypothetical protein
MSRLFISEDTGATVYAFANDHCPPHVHARHRGDGWVARIGFTYLDDSVKLLSVAPLKHSPQQRVVSRLLDGVKERLPECRQRWWLMMQTACLTHQWVSVPAEGQIELLSKYRHGARQIVDAQYDAAVESLRIAFRDNSTTEVRLRP